VDKNRFDGFTRQLAKRENRRQALKTLFAGGAGTAAAMIVGKETEAAKPPSTTVDCCPASAPKLCGSPLTCTAVATDPNNCGACDNVCQPGQTCLNGACSPPSIKCKKTRDCPGGMTCTKGVCTQPTPFCTVPEDCPPTGNECSARTCINNGCGTTNVASGIPLASQTPGDCKTVVCNGSGGIREDIDNTDLPASIPCTTSVCTNGVPSNPPVQSGTTCTGGTCDGNGHCIAGCASAEECPGIDTFCQNRTCFSGVCGFAYAPDGTPTSSQISGDCHRTVCNGSGGTREDVYDVDTPPSGPCDIGTCTNGVPSNPLVQPGTSCGDGHVCDATGNCVDCLTPNDCTGTDTECQTRTCTNGACGTSFVPINTPVADQTAGDCKQNVCDGSGNIISVNDDNDVINTHYPDECIETACSNGSVITRNKPYGSSCGDGFCDGNNVCLQCLDDGDCTDSGIPNSVTICSGGFCAYQCLAPYTDCPNGIGCIDINNDPDHCGSCDHVCSIPNGHATCANGACAIAGCLPGYADCNEIPTDGCEVFTDEDPDHCGACNIACQPGQTCIAGVCH
jgi:hypothetical protein